jgi:hypothetical protein
MGLGNDKKNYRFVSLRTMEVLSDGKKEINPRFILSTKIEGTKEYEQSEAFGYISGKLVDIKKDSYQWGDQEVKQCILFLYDKTEDATYKVEMPNGQLTRSIQNSLLTIPDFSDIKISVYRYTRKTDQKVIAAASVSWNVSANPQKADWKYSFEELKPYFDKVVFKGKEQIDSDRADEFLANLAIEYILPIVKKSNTDSGLPPSDVIERTAEETGPTEGQVLLNGLGPDRKATSFDSSGPGETDDLPF